VFVPHVCQFGFKMLTVFLQRFYGFAELLEFFRVFKVVGFETGSF